MGDDLPDLQIMKSSAISACPENAVPEIKAISDYISPIKGGSGAVRDVIEQVMKVQGNWFDDDDTQST
jgi:3-deoxy-D-manno-octulosonate 8-phosphate phosphatase (KDO 8-P phosphatase)